MSLMSLRLLSWVEDLGYELLLDAVVLLWLLLCFRMASDSRSWFSFDFAFLNINLFWILVLFLLLAAATSLLTEVLSKIPTLGPSNDVPTRPQIPPSIWIYPAPAASWNPSFESHPSPMIHDETILELLKATAHEAAHRAAELFREHVQLRMPDVKVTASPALMTEWQKSAAPVYVEGRLVPWARQW